ncbi:MAG: hypothetical protein ACTSXA_12860 [Candidatus Heimdallarchaeota archaeon]
MADLPSTPTVTALIFMAIAIVVVTIVVIRMFIQYHKRKRLAALLIAFSFFFWGLAVIATFVGALLQKIYYPINPIAGAFQYSRYGINIGYLFSALTNIFIVYFVSEIFSQKQVFKYTGKIMPILHGLLNGVTIGLIIHALVKSFDPTNPDRFNPAYPLGQTIYHLAWTLTAFTILLIFSVQARKKASLRWEKAGFSFIIATAVLAQLVYVFFTIDLAVQEVWASVFSSGYTHFNNLGWLTAAIMAILAYFGFFMPNWLRDRLKQLEAI